MDRILNWFFVAGAIVGIYAAVGIYPKESKPPAFADQEGCYLSKFNAVLPYNVPYFPKDGSCLQYTCGTNGDTEVFSCGAIGYPPNCHLDKDLTLDYPDCCGKVVCDPEDTTPPPADVTTEDPNVKAGEEVPEKVDC